MLDIFFRILYLNVLINHYFECSQLLSSWLVTRNFQCYRLATCNLLLCNFIKLQLVGLQLTTCQSSLCCKDIQGNNSFSLVVGRLAKLDNSDQQFSKLTFFSKLLIFTSPRFFSQHFYCDSHYEQISKGYIFKELSQYTKFIFAGTMQLLY